MVLRGVGTRLEYYQQFGKCLESSIFGSDVSMGFFMHFTELFMEEVAKVKNTNDKFLRFIENTYNTFLFGLGV